MKSISYVKTFSKLYVHIVVAAAVHSCCCCCSAAAHSACCCYCISCLLLLMCIVPVAAVHCAFLLLCKVPTDPLAEWLRRKRDPVLWLGRHGFNSIPNALYVLSLLCHELFNEASLPSKCLLLLLHIMPVAASHCRHCVCCCWYYCTYGAAIYAAAATHC